MKKQKQSNKPKQNKRLILHRIFGVLAAVSFAVTVVLLSVRIGLVKTAGKNNGSSSKPPSETKAKIPTDNNNYGLLIFKKVFISSQTDGITTIYAKSSKDGNMVITPKKGVSYTQLKKETEKDYNRTEKYQPLNTSNVYSVYTAEADGLVKSVYCIDDGNGSSIEIKYQYPEDNKDIKEDFDILLSMFTTR